MGKNKLGKFADMQQWEHVYEYAQSLYATQDCPLKGHWHEQVFHNSRPIVLELGCGKGEYSTGLALAYPDKNFIGIDIKGARMWTGARQVAEKDLPNVVFLRTHIEFLNHFFAPGEVAEIWLTFPDPQMKKTRKRLTSTRFMKMYTDVLAEGGVLHLKTDSRFMYLYTIAMARDNGLTLEYRTDNLYAEPLCRQEDSALVMMGEAGVPNIQTFYEAQWLARGLDIKYLRLRPEPRAEWVEPQDELPLDDYRSFGRSARSLPEISSQSL